LKVIVESSSVKREIEIEPIDRQAGSFHLLLDGEEQREVRVVSRKGDWLTLEIDGRILDFMVFRLGDEYVVDQSIGSWPLRVLDQRRIAAAGLSAYEPEGVVTLKAQMPGKIIRVLKRKGDAVEAGEGLIIIESMKMQNQLKSPKSGVVRKCEVEDGQNVNAGQLLLEVE